MPVKEDLGILVLIDEVLMYAREKVAQDKEWRAQLVNFFQYLTQAATKVDRCCIVASLLATDPRKSDTLGREIQAELYDIFQRQREEAVEPVVKEDVAEVLRRRFFTPESIKDREAFRQHVMAALKGIAAVDEQTAKQGAEAEERFLKSFPFHPDLTEVLYSKWTQLARFQRTRGVLRTFALALREAEKWDTSPLIGPAVFLAAPEKDGLSEALREMVAVADTEEWEGKKQAWTGILDSEFILRAADSEGIGGSEVPRSRAGGRGDLPALSAHRSEREDAGSGGAARRYSPGQDRTGKGLSRWAQAVTGWTIYTQLRLRSRFRARGGWATGPTSPRCMRVAAKNIPGETVRARLLDEIGKAKMLSANASAIGVRVHTLPDEAKGHRGRRGVPLRHAGAQRGVGIRQAQR